MATTAQSSTIFVVKLPSWADLESVFPPLNSLWRNQLHSLPRPPLWKSTPPKGTFVGGAALNSRINFRVMLPLHQKMKTALRNTRIIYRFIMTFWIYLCIQFLSVSEAKLNSPETHHCLCKYIWSIFSFAHIRISRLLKFFVFFSSVTLKLNISFDLISSCPICVVVSSLQPYLEFVKKKKMFGDAN